MTTTLSPLALLTLVVIVALCAGVGVLMGFGLLDANVGSALIGFVLGGGTGEADAAEIQDCAYAALDRAEERIRKRGRAFNFRGGLVLPQERLMRRGRYWLAERPYGGGGNLPRHHAPSLNLWRRQQRLDRAAVAGLP